MKIKMKHIFLALIAALMLAITMIAAWAQDGNKGGYIEYDKMMAEQAVASHPYYPIVFLMVVAGVAWLAKMGVEKWIVKRW